jgi:hypothetical protein
MCLIVQLLCEQVNTNGFTALQIAVDDQHEDCAEMLRDPPEIPTNFELVSVQHDRFKGAVLGRTMLKLPRFLCFPFKLTSSMG